MSKVRVIKKGYAFMRSSTPKGVVPRVPKYHLAHGTGLPATLCSIIGWVGGSKDTIEKVEEAEEEDVCKCCLKHADAWEHVAVPPLMLQVGDYVKVVRRAEYSRKSEYIWKAEMDCLIGKTYKISKDCGDCAYRLSTGNEDWVLPAGSLEKVPAPQPQSQPPSGFPEYLLQRGAQPSGISRSEALEAQELLIDFATQNKALRLTTHLLRWGMGWEVSVKEVPEEEQALPPDTPANNSEELKDALATIKSLETESKKWKEQLAGSHQAREKLATVIANERREHAENLVAKIDELKEQLKASEERRYRLLTARDELQEALAEVQLGHVQLKEATAGHTPENLKEILRLAPTAEDAKGKRVKATALPTIPGTIALSFKVVDLHKAAPTKSRPHYCRTSRSTRALSTTASSTKVDRSGSDTGTTDWRVRKMSSKELSACPQCGSPYTPQLDNTGKKFQGEDIYRLSCRVCPFKGRITPPQRSSSERWELSVAKYKQDFPQCVGNREARNPVVQITGHPGRLYALKKDGTIWRFKHEDKEWEEVKVP